MATATVLQFMQKTADDQTLRQQLEQVLGVGDGDISSEAALDEAESAALRGKQAPLVVEFARQHGYDFSTDELATVVDAFQKHQAGAMSDEVFVETIGLKEATSVASAPAASGLLKRLGRYLSKTYLGVELH